MIYQLFCFCMENLLDNNMKVRPSFYLFIKNAA